MGSYADDLWYRRQVQGLRRLRRSNHEERGLYVHDEGCRSQHPSRSRWRRCLGRLRFLQEALHRLAYWISLDGVEKRARSTNPLWYLTFYSVLSDDSRSAKPEQQVPTTINARPVYPACCMDTFNITANISN